MNRVLILLALLVALSFGSVLLMRELSPEVQALRDARLAADQQHVATIAGVFAGMKVACMGSVGLLALGLSAAMVYAAFIRARRAYPVWNGLYPQLPPAQHIVDINAPGSQKMAAFSWWRGRLYSGAAKSLWEEPPPIDASPETLQLPAVSPSVYSASLPRGGDLEMAFGVDAAGETVAWPLSDLGGVVIGGLTRMGKSDALAAILAYLLRQCGDGSRLQLAIADLKEGIDFTSWRPDLQALAYPVASDANGATALIESMSQELKRRGDLFRAAKVRHIEVWNSQPGREQLPYQILVIDELAELMVGKAIPTDVENQLVSFANRGGAFGMCFIGSTQRPGGDTIPTRLRDACGTRLALPCATQYHSKAILDAVGAENLPRLPGHALIMRGGEPVPIRTFYSDLKNGRVDEFVNKLPRRLAIPANATADDDAHGNDAPDGEVLAGGVAPGVIGELGGVIDGDFSAANTPAEVRSHRKGVPVADLLTYARTLLPVTLDDHAKLSEEQSALIWKLLMTTLDRSDKTLPLYSLRATHRLLWPGIEPGGHKAELLRQAADAEARKRGMIINPIRGRGIVLTRVKGW